MMYHFFEPSILPLQSRLCRQRTENVVHPKLHDSIDHKKKKSEEKHCRNHHDRGPRYLSPRRPRHVIEFFPRVLQKLNDVPEPLSQLPKKILHLLSLANARPAAWEPATGTARRKWQARRDSNPQHAVLETAALPFELLACAHLVPYMGRLCSTRFFMGRMSAATITELL